MTKVTVKRPRPGTIGHNIQNGRIVAARKESYYMKNRSIFLYVLLLMGACAAMALAAVSRTVYYHDKVLTQDAREVNGRVYVPLADVARALGGQVATRGGGYAIVTGGGASPDADTSRTAAGGANEVRGATGKVGDWFFNGYWRFRVSRVEHTDAYKFQYDASGGSDKPSGANDELVVVYCTMKNGQKNSDEPILTVHGLASQQTALTDDQGQSYPPVDFDVRSGALVSGGAKNFAIVFSVPKGTNLKDLIFTVYSYGASSKATNVRVSLGG